MPKNDRVPTAKEIVSRGDIPLGDGRYLNKWSLPKAYVNASLDATRTGANAALGPIGWAVNAATGNKGPLDGVRIATDPKDSGDLIVALVPLVVGGVAGVATLVRSAASRAAAPSLAKGVSFGSFAKFKEVVGPAGKDMQWHHIVEQTEANVSRFGAPAIHNTGNLVRLPVALHQRVSAFYSSIQPTITRSTTMTVRQWLASQSMEAQQEFGRQVLARFGAL